MRLITTIAIAATLVFAVAPALAGKGGNGNGNGGNGDGGNAPTTGVITVPDAEYAGMTTATVNPGGADTYVFVQCYTDADNRYVYAAYSPVENNQASIGPLWSTLWLEGDASCQAQEGYFTRGGFGKWVDLATTTFHVVG